MIAHAHHSDAPHGTTASSAVPDESRQARVLVLSPVRLFREGLAELVTIAKLGRAVMTLGSGDEALRVLRDGELTLVLLDAAAADATGTARRLSALACVAGIIAFAMTDDVEARLTLAECGVRGYVSREGSVSELLAAARGALRGELDCGPEFAGALARRLARVAASPGADRVDRLSFRERDIVRLVDDGMSNKEIARRLHIEVATVKNHMHHILHKLGVQRRGEAAAALRRWRASLDRSIASA